MKDYINGKVYCSDTARMLRYYIDVEELGEGYTRYSTRSLMKRARDDEYFVYVMKVTTDGAARILDKIEWIVPVSEDYARKFRRGLPELWG